MIYPERWFWHRRLLERFPKMPRDGWWGCQHGRHGLGQRRGNFCFLVVMPHPHKRPNPRANLRSPHFSPRPRGGRAGPSLCCDTAGHGATLSSPTGKRAAQAVGKAEPPRVTPHPELWGQAGALMSLHQPLIAITHNCRHLGVAELSRPGKGIPLRPCQPD